MLLATWNVNSVRVREERMLRWLSTRQPDVVCVQELKCVEEEFPRQAVESLGYQVELIGQRMYNGVAILSRSPMTEVARGIGVPELDQEARFLAATIDGVRVLCAYVPAGGENRESSRYPAKIKWLGALKTILEKEVQQPRPLVLCGDFNIAPDAKDLAQVARWQNSAVYNDELTTVFSELLALGLSDSFRLHNNDSGHFTWWDYNDLAYQRNDGLRIDHILMPSAVQDRCYRCWIDWEEREGAKPSDHAPVLADFDWANVRSRDAAPQGDRRRARRTGTAHLTGEAVFGEAAAKQFIRESFPAIATSIPEDCPIRVRWQNGYQETLRWNYFPIGVRHWTWEGSSEWHDIEAPVSS